MKYCTRCGKEHVDEAVVCVGCGCAFEQSKQPQQPMAWYKFLINFFLFLVGIGGILSGILYATNLINFLELYSAELTFGNDALYSEYLNAIAPANIVYGIFLIGFGVFALITRHNLVKFKKTGPLFFYIIYILDFISETVYNAVCYIISQKFNWTLSFFEPETFSLFGLVVSAIFTGVVVWLNYIYFKKRCDLFKN